MRHRRQRPLPDGPGPSNPRPGGPAGSAPGDLFLACTSLPGPVGSRGPHQSVSAYPPPPRAGHCGLRWPTPEQGQGAAPFSAGSHGRWSPATYAAGGRKPLRVGWPTRTGSEGAGRIRARLSPTRAPAPPGPGRRLGPAPVGFAGGEGAQGRGRRRTSADSASRAELERTYGGAHVRPSPSAEAARKQRLGTTWRFVACFITARAFLP